MYFSSNSTFGSGTVTLSNGGTVIYGYSFSLPVTNNYVLNGDGTMDMSGSFSENSGVISGAGSLTITNSGGSGELLLSGTNTYTGTTTIAAGGLTVSNGAAIVDTGAVILANSNGATLTVRSSETIGSLRGGGATGGNVSIASGQTLTVAENGSQTFAGAITNTGGLTKTGTGTLTLSGGSANTYSGTTTVSGGTLNLNKTAGVDAIAGPVAVNSGAILLLSSGENVNDSAAVTLSGGTITRGSGVSETFGALTLTGNSFLNFGGVSEAANLTFGTLSLGVYNVSVSGFALNNQLKYAAASEANGLSLLSSFSFDHPYTTSFSTGTFTITAIPEPSSYVAAIGLLALMLWPLRRRLRAK
ncbi:MAG: autotransporter-associated beta strand repeat-containing protein [Chthoniobacterales bacterium]